MKLSKAYSQYGSSMGRRETQATRDFEGKVSLQRVRLNNGGYDSGGAYWGLGEPLYRAYGESDTRTPKVAPDGSQVGEEYNDFEMYLRASNREEAKRQVLDRYPKARFYR